MVGVYKSLTDFLLMLEEDKIGDWAIDRVNDGIPKHSIQTPFMNYSRLIREVEDTIHNFEQMHPEYGLNYYSSILEANDIEWGMDSMSAKDVAAPDGKCVAAMLLGAVRAERFCDGALLGFSRKAVYIATLCSREKEYGSLDAFVISAPAHEIVKMLTDFKSKYKLRNMGEALCMLGVSVECGY